jgi:hypothetical protein
MGVEYLFNKPPRRKVVTSGEFKKWLVGDDPEEPFHAYPRLCCTVVTLTQTASNIRRVYV